MTAPTEPPGASPLLVVVGNLLVVLALFLDRPLATVLGVAALLILIPEAVCAVRAWRRTRRVRS